jgi:hypothetical protein
MPDEYWTKIGNSPKPKKSFSRKPAGPVPPPVTDKAKDAADGSDLFWCPSCKTSQTEKKRWSINRAPHVRCRGCGLIIYPKHEKTAPVTVEKRCKICQSKLRKGNGSGKCSLCDRSI